MQTPYEILGIDKNSSEADIKKAYFNLIKRFTPEKHGDEFKKIRGAYDQLKDSKKRIETDMFIFSDPYKEFVIEQPAEKRDSSAQIKIDHVFNSMVQMFSDLGRMNFSDDFNTIQ
jgi:curved DNA-binding protein CbpA